jgi:SNF2 family DNA or RNA helicase
MFKFHGIAVLVFDGKTNFENRNRVIEEFTTSQNARVLLFSKVGTVGINLVCADILIYLVRRIHLSPIQCD